MKIYVICPVRGATTGQRRVCDNYVAGLEDDGHVVFYPPRDVEQDSATGLSILVQECRAILECDAVHVLWQRDSYGSHFDLGMAFAMGKEIVMGFAFQTDPPGKSYQKAIAEYNKTRFAEVKKPKKRAKAEKADG